MDDLDLDLDLGMDMDVEEVPRAGLPTLRVGSSSTDSSRSSPGPESSSSSSSASGSDPPAPPVRRRPIPRKGHTKSRRGCLMCKRRKVKCEETLPECNHCKRLGLRCEYPPSPALTMDQPGTQLMPSPAKSLQATPTVFSMEDLQFFQHFLLTAYPPLPIKGEAVWRDVAVISHHYDFLIHAMLGLAASHLTLSSDGAADYRNQALAHRVAAITAVNKSLSSPCASKAEGDARFATMMALTFQSACMDEGMLEFFHMIRGCGVVGQMAMPSFEDGLFRAFSREAHMETVSSLRAAEGKPFHGEYVDDFLASVRSIAPLLHSTIEISFLAAVERVVRTARTSPLEAFSNASELYALITGSTIEDFHILVNPTNYAAHLLFIHFFLIEYVLGMQVLGPILDKGFPFRKQLTVAWLHRVNASLPLEYLPYMEWPLKFSGLLMDFDEYRKLIAAP